MEPGTKTLFVLFFKTEPFIKAHPLLFFFFLVNPLSGKWDAVQLPANSDIDMLGNGAAVKLTLSLMSNGEEPKSSTRVQRAEQKNPQMCFEDAGER